jgi:phosphatidylglycerophosphate synthase
VARSTREPAPAADVSPRVPVSVAGLVVAAVAMLGVQVLYMVLSGAPPAWLPFAALLILISVPTAGAAVAWLGSRITRDASEGRAALVFAGLGLVAGALWGSLLAGGLANQLADAGASGGGSLIAGAAVVVGITAAIGAGLGRLTAREAAGRPVVVVVLAVVVVAVALLGLLG